MNERITRVGFENVTFGESDASGCTRVHLGHESWMDVRVLDNAQISEIIGRAYNVSTFEELWALQPEKPGQVMMPRKNPATGKTERVAIDVPRKQLGYLKPYYFSGLTHQAVPASETPEMFMFALRHVNDTLGYGEFNEILVNWYADGADNIGMHADSPTNHRHDPEHGFVIYSLTLWEEIGNPRIFRVKPTKGGRDRLDITLNHGTLVIMGGNMQKHFKHGVPTTKKTTGRRVNITMRQFA